MAAVGCDRGWAQQGVLLLVSQCPWLAGLGSAPGVSPPSWDQQANPGISFHDDDRSPREEAIGGNSRWADHRSRLKGSGREVRAACSRRGPGKAGCSPSQPVSHPAVMIERPLLRTVPLPGALGHSVIHQTRLARVSSVPRTEPMEATQGSGQRRLCPHTLC